MTRRQLLAALSGLPLTNSLARDVSPVSCWEPTTGGSCNGWLQAGKCPPITLPSSAPPWIRPAPPDMARRPLASKCEDPYWARLSRAYRLWQALPTTDKRGPCWQRAVHANACNLLDVHSTWVFLPWHRAFIYFHERTLERLLHNAGDLAPFRLPAWDWENNPAVPLAYESSPTHPESCTHRCHDLSKPVCCHVDQLSHDSLAAHLLRLRSPQSPHNRLGRHGQFRQFRPRPPLLLPSR